VYQNTMESPHSLASMAVLLVFPKSIVHPISICIADLYLATLH
jgi:hypothetical protein